MFRVTYMVDGVEQRRHVNPDKCPFSDEGCHEPGNLDQVAQENAFPATPLHLRDRCGPQAIEGVASGD
ncbi:MAG: hypothetical protein OXI74_01245 [Rhodospirillaceae bacterium]|nr:hypothetical protein [Rhodospirillaceae bacterium]